MKKIIIFTYLQRHFKKMIPIIKELEKDTHISLVVILMTQEEKRMAIDNNIAYTMLDDYTDKKRNLDFDLAWGLEPLINAIDRIRPDLFIAIEVNFILRNAVRYCRQSGVKSLIVQHGTPNKYSLHAFVPFEGDCFAAWGQFTKDYLIENFIDPAKIVLTGGVPFDLSLDIIPNRKYIAKYLNIDPSKKWIVFTTQGTGAGGIPTEEEIKTGVVEIAHNALLFPEYQLIYQVHPEQNVEYIKKFIIEKVPNHNSIVTKYKNTEELMAASDGIVTFFSTTAIDAVVMKKPLMLINFSVDKEFLPFVKMGAAYGAYDKNEIASVFRKLLCKGDALKKGQKKAAEYVNYRNDQNALKRVVDLIYSML